MLNFAIRLKNSLSNRFAPIRMMLSEFGEDQPESRQIGQTLQEGIGLAHSGNWEDAAKIFRDELAKNPDYDVPYLWLADYEMQKHQAFPAVHMLRQAARKCRRKSFLLAKAAELALLGYYDVYDSTYLFAQSIVAMEEKPHLRDFARHRPFLFLREIFMAFDDYKGVNWATSIVAGGSSLNDQMVSSIHDAITARLTVEPGFMAQQLSDIRDYLSRKFPA